MRSLTTKSRSGVRTGPWSFTPSLQWVLERQGRNFPFVSLETYSITPRTESGDGQVVGSPVVGGATSSPRDDSRTPLSFINWSKFSFDLWCVAEVSLPSPQDTQGPGSGKRGKNKWKK